MANSVSSGLANYSNNLFNTDSSGYGWLDLSNIGSNTTNNTGLGFSDVMSGLGTLGTLGLGGLQAYTGFQNLGLSKKALGLAQNQFDFQKGLANRNLANQATVINNAYNNAAQVAAGMIGGQDTSGNWGFTSQDIIDKYTKNAESQHVSGAPL